MYDSVSLCLKVRAIVYSRSLTKFPLDIWSGGVSRLILYASIRTASVNLVYFIGIIVGVQYVYSME